MTVRETFTHSLKSTYESSINLTPSDVIDDSENHILGPPLLLGFLPSWNCSWKLNPLSSWLELSAPGFASSSTSSSASTIDLRTSRLFDSQSIPPMNISNSIIRDLCRENTRSSSQTLICWLE